ncbi:putative serine protease EDA2 [Capsicum chinense]|nr:putative serine protease EDA2 [Capsicum chinense]
MMVTSCILWPMLQLQQYFQYGSPDKLCIPVVEAKKSGEDIVNAYATYVKEYYIKTFGVSVKTYDQENLKNTAVNGDTSDRLWWFQVCTEVAYFQVAPMNDSIRSSKVNTRHVSYSWKYHLDLCRNVFGTGIYPDIDATNLYYGGTKIAVPSYITSCHNCGHGADLRGCPQSPLVPEGDAKNCSSPDAIRKVREKIVEHIDLWLSQCQDLGRSSM